MKKTLACSLVTSPPVPSVSIFRLSREHGLASSQIEVAAYIAYIAEDHAFERAARHEAKTNTHAVLLGIFSVETKKQFTQAWTQINERSNGRKVRYIGLFLHASIASTNDGLEFKPEPTSASSTISRKDIANLAPLTWSDELINTSEIGIKIAACNSGTKSLPMATVLTARTWCPAEAFAQYQGVTTQGEAGTAYFSTDPTVYKEIKATDEDIYLKAYKRAKNDPLDMLLDKVRDSNSHTHLAIPPIIYSPSKHSAASIFIFKNVINSLYYNLDIDTWLETIDTSSDRFTLEELNRLDEFVFRFEEIKQKIEDAVIKSKSDLTEAQSTFLNILKTIIVIEDIITLNFTFHQEISDLFLSLKQKVEASFKLDEIEARIKKAKAALPYLQKRVPWLEHEAKTNSSSLEAKLKELNEGYKKVQETQDALNQAFEQMNRTHSDTDTQKVASLTLTIQSQQALMTLHQSDAEELTQTAKRWTARLTKFQKIILQTETLIKKGDLYIKHVLN